MRRVPAGAEPRAGAHDVAGGDRDGAGAAEGRRGRGRGALPGRGGGDAHLRHPRRTHRRQVAARKGVRGPQVQYRLFIR